jgi:acyl-CoA synthetase (AMP-forming)/AMP-acid ligase II
MTRSIPPHILGRLESLPERVSDLVWHWEKQTPDALAMLDGDNRWTFAEQAMAVRQMMEILRQHDVRSGDRVMLVNETGRATVALVLAIMALDAWAVIVNARLSTREIEAIADHSGARRLIFTVDVSKDAAEHARHWNAEIIENELLGKIAISGLAATVVPELVSASGKEQVAALIYTSGTTGAPKGVMLTHRNLLFIAGISGGMRGFVATDVIYGVLPLSHAYGLASVFLGGLYAGACFMPCARFDAAQTLSDIHVGMTALQGVPAMYAKLLAHVRTTGATLSGHRLRFISAGGSPLDAAIKNAAEDLIGLPLHNGYGMTEASPSMAMTLIDNPRPDCSVGQPLPFVELAAVDIDGKPLPQGATGDIWCRGPGVMKGYYRAPDLTAAALTEDGWLKTGDVGRFDEDGSLHIAGRSKELIIRSGFNIYPPEVEGILNGHPQVVQAAVVGAPGADGNEEVVAYLQVTPDNCPTTSALADFCAGKLAPYKRPTRFILCEALPASATGKVLKHRLAEATIPFSPK